MRVSSTSTAPNKTHLRDIKVGGIGVIRQSGGTPLPAGHYLRTYSEFILLDDPLNTWDSEAFEDETGSDFECEILPKGSIITLVMDK